MCLVSARLSLIQHLVSRQGKANGNFLNVLFSDTKRLYVFRGFFFPSCFGGRHCHCGGKKLPRFIRFFGEGKVTSSVESASSVILKEGKTSRSKEESCWNSRSGFFLEMKGFLSPLLYLGENKDLNMVTFYL